MLDGRDIKLIDIIEAHPDIDPVDLAERFSVSERSVRTYVRKTNEALGSCAQIEKRRGGGYSLRVLNASAFAALRARDAHAGQDAVPTTPEARVDYLLNDLLSRADWITVDDLARAPEVVEALDVRLEQIKEVVQDAVVMEMRFAPEAMPAEWE